MKSKKAQPRRKPSGKATPRAKNGRKKKKKSTAPLWRRLLIKYSLLALLAGLIGLFTLFGAVYIGLFGKLPDKETLLGLRNTNASELYSADGKLLGKYFIENRSSIGFDDIPETVIEALVATEDSRFFTHEGIDLYSIPRVVIKTVILRDRSGGGGSTISQQLIKNLFGRSDHGALSMPVNKLKENVTALKLEEVYSKEEIITLYLNTVSFGENVFGIKAASQRYFSKLPKELTVSEAAVLIGMLKANTSYNPRLYPEASMRRRNTVLALMVREGFLEADAFNELTEMPIKLNYRKLDGREAPARYFQVFAEREVAQILEEIGSEYDLYRDGLVIKTTLNASLQSHAENAVHDQMKKLQAAFDEHWAGRKPWGADEEFIWKSARNSQRYKRMKSSGASDEEIRTAFTTKTSLLRYTSDGMEQADMTPLDSVAYHQMILQAGFTAIDPNSGNVLAYVGGIDFNQFPYDHVRSARQSGSTFKPFVYAAAIDAGFSPCDYIENERIIFANYDDWSPENAGGEYGGYYSVRGGLANSVNTIAARLIAEIGPEAVIEMARSAGITTDLPKGPAISLGVADISLIELTTAYAVFANGGKRIKPVFITSIATAEGEIIYEAPKSKPVQAIDPETALTTMYMMQSVVDSGTARSIRSTSGVRMPLAGKTGTTQNNADGWFIAASPGMVCGAWVGGESPLVRFRSTALGQGARTALPIVGTFLRKAETDNATAAITRKSFPEVSAQIRLDSYCAMYRDKMGLRLFESLFDGEAREEKRELRQEAREERREERRRGREEDGKEKDGWMRRLIDKFKKED